MQRREFLSAGVAIGAGVMAAPSSEASPVPALASPLDREILTNIDHITQFAAEMRMALLAAQTSDLREREGHLFDMRSALGMILLTEDHIGQKAWEQAMELNPDTYRKRRYRRPGRWFEAIVTLRKAGWSWKNAVDAVIGEKAIATGVASIFARKERAGEAFMTWPNDPNSHEGRG